ncbi:MAG: hypothetical protein ACREJC_15170 [Tepidisphaeraceae bacterium]
MHGRRARIRQIAGAFALFVSLCAAARLSAQPYIDLGIADSLAPDQPRAVLGLEDPANPGKIVGPNFFNTFLLDTGANGIVFADLAYFDSGPYALEHRTNGDVVIYDEQGVAGTEPLEVFQPYLLNIAGDDGIVVPGTPLTRVFGRDDLNLGGLPGIAGMPVMVGRNVAMNLRPMTKPGFIETSFPESLPARTPNTYHVSMSMLPPVFTGQQFPDDPLPTFAPLPLVDGVRFTHNTSDSTNDLVLDTGAQLSFVGSEIAISMGYDLDPNSPTTDLLDLDGNGIIDEDDYLPVGGIGGEVLVPFIRMDRMSVPTEEGIDLVFRDIEMGVLDIPGIGGIFSMNFLTTGYFDLIFGGGDPEEFGAFSDIYLDFTGVARGEEQATLILEMNPLYNVVIVPEPTTPLVTVLLALTAIRRRASERPCRFAPTA